MNKEEIMQMSGYDVISNFIKHGIDPHEYGWEDYHFSEYEFAYKMEEKIKAMDYTSEYIEILEGLIPTDINDDGNFYRYAFEVAHASPIDRLRAALMVLEGVKE